MSDRETPWEFLPEDEEAEDGEGSAEELAVHVEPIDRSRVSDPGRSDVDVGSEEIEELAGFHHYADEESEDLVDGGGPTEAEREPDVQELLERQGYAFAEEDDDDEPGGGAGGTGSVWRRRLVAERQRLVALRLARSGEHPADVSQRELDSELSSADQHQADAASTTYELEVEHSLVRQIDDELDEVDAALARVGAGTYGRCERCGGPIGDERLRALPAARYCATDERMVEMTNGPLPPPNHRASSRSRSDREAR